MREIYSLLDNYAGLPAKLKKFRLNDILDEKNIITQLFSLLDDTNQPVDVHRSVTAVLCDAANKDKFKSKIFNTLSGAKASALIAHPDPKVRKNIAKLLGAANREQYASVIIDAIKSESTEFVLDSLILALGYTDYSENAYAYLSAYTPKAKQDKHREKELAAIEKALSTLKKVNLLEDIALNGESVLLTYPAETPDALKEELNASDIPFTESLALNNALAVKPQQYSNVFQFRCFFEALIDLGEADVDDNHQYLSPILTQIQSLIPQAAYQLRFDLRYLNPEQKGNTMTALVAKLAGTPFTSSPSNYQFELRLVYQKSQVHALLSVPSLDTRFAYRTETIPASINPVIAANIMRTILPYLTEDATVLDPFCGAGTLLYERDVILPCEELIGVDIKKDAIYKAKKNFLREDIPVGFLVSDILEADLEQEFDEIISNMPFGRRVSDAKNNETLYAEFVQLLKTLLKRDGYAFLYTNQKILMKNLIKGDMKLELVDEILFEAGGLFPSLFIIKRIR